MMRIVGVLLIAMGFLGAGGLFPAAAQQGLLNTVAYGEIAPGAPIAVRPLDNSDQNLVLQEHFERQLRAKGYAVSDDANLVLSFDTRDVVGAWSDGGVRTVIELKNNRHRTGQDPPQINLNIYNSSRGGLLNRGQSGGTLIVTPSQYRLDAVIDNHSNGERVWQAWATAEIRGAGTGVLGQTMVPALVANLGGTVKNQPFSAR
ncbi:MAG TPA: hypothetical protein QGG32_02365 [Rhodospirillales bacterium]|jgi:hypothetical protein|nr:hypothetical protein [Rhodospirillales bacterium]